MNEGNNSTYYTKDGLELRIRPLDESDAHHLIDLFENMGPESRFLRFHVALSNPDSDAVWAEARRLAQVDQTKDGAWLVFADLPNQSNAPVAGARYIRINSDAAEASLAVRDDLQNRGIGWVLVQFLQKKAREAGIRTIIATIQRGNRPVWRLLQKSSLNYEHSSEGSSTTITVDLSEPEVVT